MPPQFPSASCWTLPRVSPCLHKMADKTSCRKFVPVYDKVTKEYFISTIYPCRHPAVLKGIELGEAIDKWTPEYLASQAGDTPVKVHVCPTAQMDFLRKNFVYRYLMYILALNWNLCPVVRRVDNFIQRINPYPADKIGAFLILIGHYEQNLSTAIG